MSGKGFSEFGKSVSEGHMTSVALNEAKTWTEALLDAEHRGRRDTDGAARYRLAKRIGLRESYLYRLQYKASEMKDVAGSAYRSLMLAYEELCERNEAAADRLAAERLSLKANHEATDKKLDPTSNRVDQAAD
jgi:hypothetical protein